MINVGDRVRVVNPDLKVQDEMLSQLCVMTLKAVEFKGTVTQIQNDLYYVGFKHAEVWITQVFKAEEIERV